MQAVRGIDPLKEMPVDWEMTDGPSNYTEQTVNDLMGIKFTAPKSTEANDTYGGQAAEVGQSMGDKSPY